MIWYILEKDFWKFTALVILHLVDAKSIGLALCNPNTGKYIKMGKQPESKWDSSTCWIVLLRGKKLCAFTCRHRLNSYYSICFKYWSFLGAWFCSCLLVPMYTNVAISLLFCFFTQAILQFFLDFGEVVLHDADPSLSTFFRFCLSRYKIV